MKCSDVKQVLPEIIDGSGDAEFQQHLECCSSCSGLVAELKLIAAESRQLAEIDEPPARVWVGIANQLRSEGIIRDRETSKARPVLVPPPARRWNARWLAPVAVAIVAVGSYQLAHKTAAPGAQQVAEQAPSQPQPQASQPSLNAQAANSQAAPQSVASPTAPPASRAVELAERGAQPSTGATAQHAKFAEPTLAAEASPPASEEDQRFLSEVSQRAPTMRATYENQLRAVNAEIQETQEYIKRYPDDLDARQHLMEVYQEKALLYQMALDRIQ